MVAEHVGARVGGEAREDVADGGGAEASTSVTPAFVGRDTWAGVLERTRRGRATARLAPSTVVFSPIIRSSWDVIALWLSYGSHLTHGESSGLPARGGGGGGGAFFVPQASPTSPPAVPVFVLYCVHPFELAL